MRDADVIVIGSGAGGLAAAVALAQAGKKVIVLEQHYLPGGWCHSFTLEGYRFSPGVHYIGELGPEGRMRRIYEGLGLGDDLSFYELNPDGYDHIYIGDAPRFDIPRGRDRFRERLTDRFPRERRGIEGYLGTVEQLDRELQHMMELSGPKDLLTLPWKAPAITKWGLRTGKALIDSHVDDPILRGILAGQSGDHGLPPSQIPAAIHAAVTAHYFDGGYYPKGGAHSLPRAYIRALRRAGGEIHVKTAVERILVEDGCAIGVRLQDGRELRADHVISNADPEVTFNKLVGEEHLGFWLRRRLRRTTYSVSGLSLFMAAKIDARGLGLDSGNYWVYLDPDVDRVYRLGLGSEPLAMDSVPGFFLTLTTLKDPSKDYGGTHTMESFAFIGYEAFARWAGSTMETRPADYKALKEKLMQRMLTAIERVIPGIKESVVFKDLGTPLTNDFYCAATEGNFYGTSKHRSQIGPFAYTVRTPIRRLSMCGASTLSHGVLGATLSGLVAASRVTHGRVADFLKRGQPPITLDSAEQPKSSRKQRKKRGAEAQA